MLVYDLIEKLKTYPPNHRVFINTQNMNELDDLELCDDYTADTIADGDGYVTIGTDPNTYDEIIDM